MAGAAAWPRALLALATLGLTVATAPRARAIEAFDGRIQAHGFFELQLRMLDADFAEEADVSQWYNVFNLELEADILPDGWGPFDLLQAYVRVEGRYDAIYSHGFYLFPAIKTFGDGARRLPLRLRDALDQDYAGVIESNAQARPPGIPFRVPDEGDLDEGVARGPDTKSYAERDPVGFSVELTAPLPILDYRPDDDGNPTPDLKNPVDVDDLDFIYVSPQTGAEFRFAEEGDPRVSFAEDPLTLDRVEADCSQVACRALPANGFGPDSPRLQGGNAPAGNQAKTREGEFNTLIDTGNTLLTDPLTGETGTAAELYGDIQLERDANGVLVPVGGGRSVNGFGARIQGSVVTDDTASPILPFDGTARLIGFNTTCPTNRRDSRNAYARQNPNEASSEFLYSQPVRQRILQSGKRSCLDNRLEETTVQQRIGFPGFDTLFDQEGGDAELGVNPDFSDPDLVDRDTPVSELAALVDRKLQDPGSRVTVDGRSSRIFQGIANGGLQGDCIDQPGVDCDMLEMFVPNENDRDVYFVEQELLNDFAPFFRGIAQPRDDPAFYVFDGSPDRDESITDWRFTFTEIKGPEGGLGGTQLLGPVLPKNFFDSAAAWADRANPFRGREAPTVTARNQEVAEEETFNVPFEQTARVSGERYQVLDVTATERELAEQGAISPDDPAFDYVPDDVGIKTDPIPDDGIIPEGPGGKVVDTDGNLIALDLPNARFQPEGIDSRLERVDELVTLLGDAGIRLRRQINRPSQLEVGDYPNEILRLPERQASVRIANVPRFTSLLQRDGTSLGGDFSGIIPCLDTQRKVTRTGEPAPAQLESQLSGFSFARGCVPFTNVNATGGRGELPMRPSPDLSNLLAGDASAGAQGLYIPSAGFTDALENTDFDDDLFNINETELSWNRGASQRQTYEVKEAYADMEFLDSRLWIRAGLQNIVWGKTELFRTTDQFNPQDFALASLPSLEESRIALISARAVYSLYDVGPLQDVRLEFAANVDRFEPADLGVCGEPYTIDIVCGITAGLAFHGLTGVGIAGVDRPPNAWDDIDGVEFGGRIEFRWDRFSFAIVDFYGYNDFPFADQIFSYERTVDVGSGRPLRAYASGPCENAAGFADRDPLAFGPEDDLAFGIGGEPAGISPVRAFSAGNRRLAAEVDFVARRPLLTPQGDPSALPTGLAAEFGADPSNPRDDYVKHPLAYTIQGIGIDPGCLKPGGSPGGPNENRFDTALAPALPLGLVFDSLGNLQCVDANGDGKCFLRRDLPDNPTEEQIALFTDYPKYSGKDYQSQEFPTFNHSTFGQWENEGESIDYALGFHPGNQQLFAFTCLATVSISASLDPGACAWTIFGTSRNISSVIDVPLSELVTMFTAGERGDPISNLTAAILSNTKGGEAEFGNVVPLVALSRDARDGLTTAGSVSVTGRDPLNPADLDDRLTIGNTMTSEQMALLGCGPFFGTRCDSGRLYNTDLFLLQQTRSQNASAFRPPPARPYRGADYPFLNPDTRDPTRIDTPFEFGANSGGGIDPLNMEASAVLQAFPGIEGSDQVRGTTRVLQRLTERELLDLGFSPEEARERAGELRRLGDGTVDLNRFGLGVPLSADGTRYAIPTDPLDSSIDPQQRTYQELLSERESLTSAVETLEGSLDTLRDSSGCDEDATVLDGRFLLPDGEENPDFCGLNQYLNREFSCDGSADQPSFCNPSGGLNAADSTGKEVVEGDIDAVDSARDFALNGDGGNVDGLNDILLILDDATEELLGEFSAGGAYESFGRTRQETVDGTEVEDGGTPKTVPLDGAVVDGLEDFGEVTSTVTWSNAPQPGTLGNAGLAAIERDTNGNFVSGGVQRSPNPFPGGPYCTRYAPESPFANDAGIVRLPGCRSALSVTVNTEAPSFDPDSFFCEQNASGQCESAVPYDGTVEVVFEDFYDPRVDGCVFGPTVRSQDGRLYKVQAVNGDGSLDGLTQAVLDVTCFNRNLDGVQSTTFQGREFIRLPTSPGAGDGDLDDQDNPIVEFNNDGTTSFRASTTRRARDPLDNYSVRPGIAQAFTETLYHPWAGCEGSSPISGAPLSGIPLSNFQGRAIGRAWAVDRAAPAIGLQDQRDVSSGGTRIDNQFFLDDGEGNFVIDSGVETNVRDAQQTESSGAVTVSKAANGSRATFVCDVRTRDFDNDFLEGALALDLNDDGLVAGGAQVFRSEMAAWSWNFLMFLTISSCNATSGGDDLDDADCFRPSTPWANNRCSFSQPQFCRNVKGILGVAGVRRNDVRAGGNGRFGRRDFIWHSGGELVLRYKRRNVFGISADFAEDVTKTNWGVEFTWFGARPFLDNDSTNNVTSSHTLNLTISVDRPTFINFLNANRTFFMNTQWFFQYLPDWDNGFATDGPFNALFTFAVFTGYYQDRLLPQIVTVYDFRSSSGAFLPQLSYRFTESFSITIGVSFFVGRGQRIRMPVNAFAPTQNRAGPNAYTDGVERALSLIRDRDEAFMRIRWTF